jgi:hypothetical protein
LGDVAPYFDAPLEMTILDRYELRRQADIPHFRISENPDELVVKEKQVLDPSAGESAYAMNAAGTTRASVSTKGSTATARIQMSGEQRAPPR